MRKCCVLIPFYNDGENLLDTINSIDGDPDVIIVDDGSTTPAIQITDQYTGILSLKIISLPFNSGIEHALNAGLKYCIDRYEYIARLDCGDKCKNNRIKKQLSYLEKNLDCCLLGSWVDFISESGKYLFTSKVPSENDEIRKKMYINSMFIHPSVIIRSSALKDIGMYPTNRKAAEDYALFFKFTKKCRTANLTESLLDYVVSPNSISTKKRKTQIISRIKVILDNFEIGIYPFYGIIRSLILLLIPRTVSILLRKLKNRY